MFKIIEHQKGSLSLTVYIYLLSFLFIFVRLYVNVCQLNIVSTEKVSIYIFSNNQFIKFYFNRLGLYIHHTHLSTRICRANFSTEEPKIEGENKEI